MDEQHIARIDRLTRQRKWGRVLALMSFMPFLACALAMVLLGSDNPLSEPVVDVFRAYSVAILSFLGGIRWGHALLRTHDETGMPEIGTQLSAVAPCLLAWATIFAGDVPAVGILLLAVCAQGAWDSLSATRNSLPAWFAQLRIFHTFGVAAAHIAVFIVLIQRV